MCDSTKTYCDQSSIKLFSESIHTAVEAAPECYADEPTAAAVRRPPSRAPMLSCSCVCRGAPCMYALRGCLRS